MTSDAFTSLLVATSQQSNRPSVLARLLRESEWSQPRLAKYLNKRGGREWVIPRHPGQCFSPLFTHPEIAKNQVAKVRPVVGIVPLSWIKIREEYPHVEQPCHRGIVG